MIRTRANAAARWVGMFLVFSLAGLSAGCNLWSGLHKDGVESNANVLVADGQAALDRGDYTHARDYFALAVGQDPRNAEARVGYVRAELKRRNFNLVNLVRTIMDSAEDGGESLDILDPADWGAEDMTALVALFDEFLGALDPITQGLTEGAVRHDNVTVLLDTAFFYAFRFAARAQEVSTTYELVQFSKSDVTPSDPGLTPAEFSLVFPLLPEEFWWLDNAPSTALLTQLAADINAAVARLEAAAYYSDGNELILDLLDYVKGLQVQTQI